MKIDLGVQPSSSPSNSLAISTYGACPEARRVVKTALLVFGLLFIPFTAESRSISISKIKEKAPETIFLRKVESAVRVHDADLLLSFMLPEYKRTQHDEFLDGRTLQFLSEFFWCPEKYFDQITGVTLVSYKLQTGSKTDYDVVFHLKHNNTECDCSFGMRKDNNTNVFSIYSAVG